MSKCGKCQGEGWLWWHELNQYDGPAADVHDCYSDDTKYPCDSCGGSGGCNTLSPQWNMTIKGIVTKCINDMEYFGDVDLTDLPQQLRSEADNHNEGSSLEVLLRVAADEIERLRERLDRYQRTYEGWLVVKECDDGSLILQSHTGERRHVWQEEAEESLNG